MEKETNTENYCFQVKISNDLVLELIIPKDEEDPSNIIEKFCTLHGIGPEQKQVIYRNILSLFLEEDSELEVSMAESEKSFRKIEEEIKVSYSKKPYADKSMEQVEEKSVEELEEVEQKRESLNGQMEEDFSQNIERMYQMKAMESFQEHETESVIELQDQPNQFQNEDEVQEIPLETESDLETRKKPKKRNRVEDRLIKLGEKYKHKKTLIAKEIKKDELKGCTFKPKINKSKIQFDKSRKSKKEETNLDNEDRCVKVKEILDSLAQNDFKIQIRNKANNESYFWNQKSYLTKSDSISKMFFSTDSRKEEPEEGETDLQEQINDKLDRFMRKQNPESQSVEQLVSRNKAVHGEKETKMELVTDSKIGTRSSAKEARPREYTFGKSEVRLLHEKKKQPKDQKETVSFNKSRIYLEEDDQAKPKKDLTKTPKKRVKKKKYKIWERNFKSHIKYKEAQTYQFKPKINKLPDNYAQIQQKITYDLKIKDRAKSIESNLKGSKINPRNFFLFKSEETPNQIE